MIRLATTALVAATLLVAPASAKDKYVYGPPPEWEHFKALATAAVLAELPDPDNWSIEWPNGYAPAGWGHKGAVSGYLTCARLRAKQPVNGRSVMMFATVIDYDQVKRVDISTSDRNGIVNVLCDYVVKRGILPPAPASSAQVPHQLTIASLGIAVRAMPEGAYVSEVRAGSPAARAGLVAGMVIGTVNGLPLAGMDSAIGKVLNSDTPELTLGLVTGEAIRIHRDQDHQ